MRIMRCQREIDQIPRAYKETESEAEQMRLAAKTAKDELMAHQSEVKKTELEIESVRQKIAKLREQQFQIKSNDEFKALNKEIVNLNEEIKVMEDREITSMEMAEEARQRESKALENLRATENAIKERLQALGERQAGLETEIRQLQADRDHLAKSIAGDWLLKYNRILENKRDQALVAVENGACAGCRMHLPAQVICDLKKKSDLIACSFCGRILYLVP